MRRRLRATPTPAELAELYRTPHEHTRWADHIIRVDVTSAVAVHLVGPGARVADLSCGDATIARRLAAAKHAELVLGDYAPGYPHTGPIETTIDTIDPVDLFLCCETLEHLDDPDLVLKAIRAKTEQLVISTPDGERDDSNPEHVWSWGADDVERMLTGAGFAPTIYLSLDLRPAGYLYCYQIWVCR